jgi:hypothetical protein
MQRDESRLPPASDRPHMDVKQLGNSRLGPSMLTNQAKGDYGPVIDHSRDL